MTKIINRAKNLYLFFRFIANNAGREYGVGHLQKAKLALRMKKNNKEINSLSTWQQHILLAEEIFRVPKSLKGDVVECGCYNGASTANLSLACALTSRRLFVCDSFEGLPEPHDDESDEICPDFSDYWTYEAGDLSSKDGLKGVKSNVEALGDSAVCEFVKGYFKDTLKELDTDSVILIFEDADLRSAVQDCLQHLWPKLQENCKFYCHEPWSVHVVSLFYDVKWWRDNLNSNPPGFYGSGNGIVNALTYSFMGYAKKFDIEKAKIDRQKRALP